MDSLLEFAVKKGYHEFNVVRWVSFYGKQAVLRFIQENELNPLRMIRLNTIRMDSTSILRLLKKKGIILEKKGPRYCYVVKHSRYPLGATTEYLTGLYFIQGMSSQWAVEILEPFRGEVVLDMCAAPGGKTTLIAQYQSNEGVILACDISKDKIKTITFNVSRLGVSNVIIRHGDARLLHKDFPPESFDRILLDVPCSGSGIIRKDHSRKQLLSLKSLHRHQKLQIALLKEAVYLVKEGGYILYSTCSLEPEENEDVIQNILNEEKVILEEIELPGSIPGIAETEYTGYPSIYKKVRRLLPSQTQDGFFICRMKKC